MDIIYDAGSKSFIARTTYAERLLPKSAGFRWDAGSRHWWTRDLSAVAKVDRYLTAVAREAFEENRQTREQAVVDSRATNADIDIPHPDGLDYLPFQKAGVSWAMSRPAALIADEMGLGKTIQALGVINVDPSINQVLVVCPLSVALNWKRETEKWVTRSLTARVATAQKWPTDANVVIVHWGIVAKHSQSIRSQNWDLIVLDESHYAKNPKASRTKAILGDYQSGVPALTANRKLALTGTPIPNRPIEIQPVLKWLNPAEFGNWMQYARRYCDASQTRFGWDTSGSAHLDELQEKLRSTVMIRRKKSEVLKELPAKSRQVILINPETPALRKALKAERAAAKAGMDTIEKAQVAAELAKSGTETDYAQAVQALRQARLITFQEMSETRHDTAIAKIPEVLEHIRDVLDEQGKVVVFAHHRDVIKSLESSLKAGDKEHEPVGVVKIYGGIKPEERQQAVDSFQDDPSTRVFLGSIGAAKEGITLTSASRAVFAELDWVPGNLSQAEDRIHRIGQKDAVTIRHILLDGSLDAKMAQTIVQKQFVLDQALDDQHQNGDELDYQTGSEEERFVEDDELVTPPATRSTTREEIANRAEFLTSADIARVQAGLRQLSRMDADFAQAKNDAGFSKIDVSIGHDLADRDALSPKQAALGAKLLSKYHRQLDPEIAGIWKSLGERHETKLQRQVPAQPLPEPTNKPKGEGVQRVRVDNVPEQPNAPQR